MLIRIILLLFITILLTACGAFSPEIKDGPPTHPIDLSKIKKAIPRHLPKSHYGNPSSYVALGKRYYVLSTAKGYNKKGIASWYGTKFNGELTSSREPYDMLAMTAASPVLPIPCFVRVTNLENGRSVIVKVNDRGPFAPNRIIDLSYAAAVELGYANKGTALVDVRAIDVDHYWAERDKPRDAPINLPHHPQLYLQLGAFADEENAMTLKNNARHYTQKPIKIVRRRQLYAVQVGSFKGVGEADQIYLHLKHHGFENAFTTIR